jgi:hypothetical protein
VVPKATQQRDLRRVADGLAVRKCTNRDVEPKDRANHRQDLERHSLVTCKLDAADLGVRHADEVAQRLLREPRRQTRFPKLVSHRAQPLSCDAPAAVGTALPCDHRRIIGSSASLPVIWHRCTPRVRV